MAKNRRSLSSLSLVQLMESVRVLVGNPKHLKELNTIPERSILMLGATGLHTHSFGLSSLLGFE